ncbi:hypothetical protein ACFQY5_04210 [Paeniroseomonas aquatica]
MLLIRLIGIEGAAIAWALRAATDCLGKLWLVGWLYPPAATTARQLALPLLAGGAGLLLLLPMPGLPGMVVAGCFGFAAFLTAAFRTLDPMERNQLGSMVRHPALLLRPELT